MAIPCTFYSNIMLLVFKNFFHYKLYGFFERCTNYLQLQTRPRLPVWMWFFTHIVLLSQNSFKMSEPELF